MKSKPFTASIVASVLLASLAAVPAMAHSSGTPNIDLTQHQIRDRIQQGIATGRITQQEARMLYQRERDIAIREDRMKRDGVATPHERQQLRQDLDGLRAEVERKIANRQVAVPPAARTPGIDKNQHLIRTRIDRGVRSGHITRKEAETLYQRERHLHRMEVRFKSDGYVGPEERRRLQSETAMLRDDVERMMRNDRRYASAR